MDGGRLNVVLCKVTLHSQVYIPAERVAAHLRRVGYHLEWAVGGRSSRLSLLFYCRRTSNRKRAANFNVWEALGLKWVQRESKVTIMIASKDVIVELISLSDAGPPISISRRRRVCAQRVRWDVMRERGITCAQATAARRVVGEQQCFFFFRREIRSFTIWPGYLQGWGWPSFECQKCQVNYKRMDLIHFHPPDYLN